MTLQDDIERLTAAYRALLDAVIEALRLVPVAEWLDDQLIALRERSDRIIDRWRNSR